MRKLHKVLLLTFLAVSLWGNVYLFGRLAKLSPHYYDRLDALENPTDEFKQRRTVMAIDSLLLQINLYMALTGKPPKTIDILQSPLDADGPNLPLDCYGRRIEYNINSNEVTLLSAGADGVLRTDDDIIGRMSLKYPSREIESPIGNWFSETSDCEPNAVDARCQGNCNQTGEKE